MFSRKKIIYSVSFIVLLVNLFLLFHYSSILNDGLRDSKLFKSGNFKSLSVNSFQAQKDSSFIEFKFLKEEDLFVGIEAKLKDSIINFSAHKKLRVNLQGTTSKFVSIYLIASTFDNEYEVSECIVEKDLYLNTIDNIYTININEFSIKPWWYQSHNIPIKKGGVKPDFKKVLRIGIGVSNTPNIALNESIRISIKNLEYGFAIETFAPFIIAAVFVLVVTFLSDFITRKTYLLKAVTNEEFLKIEENETVRSQIITFVGKHYKNHRIDIQHISDISKIHPIQINEILKRHYKLNFKQYITKIRITEAKRLLKESECTVKEISSMVGFKHVSILNRELKKDTGKTPTEIRNTNNPS